jgi:hypothetical protein
MSLGGSGPNIPSPALSDVGKGRFPGARRVAILERYDGATWAEVGRYGSVRDANVALDESVAAGADAGTLRVSEAERKTSTLVLMVLGAVLFVAAVAFVLYVFLGG